LAFLIVALVGTFVSSALGSAPLRSIEYKAYMFWFGVAFTNVCFICLARGSSRPLGCLRMISGYGW
jgi:hypothetical protein